MFSIAAIHLHNLPAGAQRRTTVSTKERVYREGAVEEEEEDQKQFQRMSGF